MFPMALLLMVGTCPGQIAGNNFFVENLKMNNKLGGFIMDPNQARL